MADMSTETMSEAAAEVPDYPMARVAGCPLAPAPVALELNAVKPLSRVRIWDGSTPWLITGYDAIRALFTDSRASVDDRKPGYPHWNEGMLATVDKRPRSVFTSDAEEHTRFRRMLSKPFTFKRVESLRPAIQQITDEHIEAKMAEPAEDAVSDLADRVKAGEIDVREAAQLGTGVLIAGHETTANMIGLGTLALLENPGQLALLRDTDDPKVVANAVEELLRYLSIIQNGQRRIALADIEIAGEVIRAGEGIIIDLAPANWDPKVFDVPDRVDLQRDGAAQNVAFGYGRHQCVGQQLARAELQIVFTTLLRRVPTLRLAVPIGEIPFKHDRLAYGVYELPVTW